MVLKFSTFCSILDDKNKIKDYEYKIGRFFLYKSENFKNVHSSKVKNSIMKNLLDVKSNFMKDYQPVHSCLLGDWVYFVPNDDKAGIIVENPLENSWYTYSMADDVGFKKIQNLICLRDHIAVVGTCHDDFNKLSDKSKDQTRIVLLTHGGERSFLYNRVLTSHNFAADISKPKAIKHVSESDHDIFITYTEKESATTSTEGNYKTIVMNKKGPQAYMKIIVNFNQTSAETQKKKMEATTLSLNSFTNNKNSNNKPVSLNFETLMHEIELKKANKTIKNKVLRR